jgi:hypothetical protein
MKRSQKWITRLKTQFRENYIAKSQKEWKHHLLSLYIIRKTDGICLFSHHFQIGLISQIENQLVGMGFTALERMMREIVDSSAHLELIDLGKKKVLVEERKNLLAVLITTDNSQLIRLKLEELTNHFEKMFELQQQISLETCVKLEDYALTAELVSIVFKDKPNRILEIIPIIFKSIRNNNIPFANHNETLHKTLSKDRFLFKETERP